MYYSNVDEVRKLMNTHGKGKKPFLFAVNFEMSEGIFLERPFSQSEVLFYVREMYTNAESNKINKNFHFSATPLTYPEYKQKFDIIHNNLLKGNSYLTNLTIKTPVTFNLSLDEIFKYSDAPYKILIRDKFVCFSPERFVKISGNRISTNPMKGTINASIPNAEQIILNDYKETAEHNTIVDLLRNDLSMVATNVRVNRFRYIDHIKTNISDILQVSSEITGTIKENPDNLGDIIFRMLPAGSISGAPKDATIQSIKAAEQEPRGYYTGIFGYYNGTELDTAVMIRYIEKEGDKDYFRSGGGITAYSDCLSEYNEVLNKIYLPII